MQTSSQLKSFTKIHLFHKEQNIITRFSSKNIKFAKTLKAYI
jgi:hypothetical protein